MADVSSGRSLAGNKSGQTRSEQIGTKTAEGFDVGVGAAAGVGLHGAGLEAGVNHSLMTGKNEFEHNLTAPGVTVNTTSKEPEIGADNFDGIGAAISLGLHSATLQLGFGLGTKSVAGEAEVKAYGYVKAPYGLLEVIGPAIVGAITDTAYLDAFNPDTFGAADPAYSGPFNLDLAINPPTPESIGPISYTPVDPVPPTPITPVDGATWNFGFMPNVPDVPVAQTPPSMNFEPFNGGLLGDLGYDGTAKGGYARDDWGQDAPSEHTGVGPGGGAYGGGSNGGGYARNDWGQDSPSEHNGVGPGGGAYGGTGKGGGYARNDWGQDAPSEHNGVGPGGSAYGGTCNGGSYARND